LSESEGEEEELKIPKRFKLLGATVEVVENPKLLVENCWAGSADYNQHVIEMMPLSEAFPVSKAKYEQTFCHELMHFLLYYGGAAVEEALHQNEELVEQLGCMLHQVLTTMEYE
jgi:hypothetical protein